MKGKIMAVAAVLVMVFAAVGVVMPQTGDSNADTIDTTDLGWIALANGTTTSGSKTINTTEGQFTGYAYTMTMSMNTAANINAADGWTTLGTYEVSTAGSDGTYSSSGSYTSVSGLSVSVTKNKTPSVGSYTLTATCSNTFTTTSLVLKAQIVSTAGTATNTQTIYYSVKVMDITSGYSQTMYLNTPTTVTGGSYYSDQIEATVGGTSYNTGEGTTALTVTNYTWYAYNLPTGLSMSATGYISGIYTGSETSKDATVIAMNADASEIYTGTLSFTNMTAFTDGVFTLTVKDGEAEITGGYVVKTTSSTAMTLSLSAKLGESELTSEVTYSVIAVDSNGAVKDLYSSGSSATVPLNGSGAYRIVVTATYTASGATYEATSSFYLYVMPVFANLSAHISVTASS